jgi:SEC-C motif-containing protein
VTKLKIENFCPCSSGKIFTHCCKPFIAGILIAPTAVTLMRSRYSAYTLGNPAYLQRTWHPTTRPKEIIQQPCKWVGLSIISYHQEELCATVEFVARFKVNGRAEKLHETSRFVFENKQWFYVDGDFLD